MFERYTEKARRVIFFARYEASQFGSPYIETEHLLLGLLREDKHLTNRFLRSHAATESIRKEIQESTTMREKVHTSIDLPISIEGKHVMAFAAQEAETMGRKHIGTEHLLLGILREENCLAAAILRRRGVHLETVREELQIGTSQSVAPGPVGTQDFSAVVRDLTQAAVDGSLQPLVGRELELECLIEVLSQRRRRNLLLIGENGVGRSALVEGLAQQIAAGKVPGDLQEKRILSVDPAALAGWAKASNRFEGMGRLVSALVRPERAILFIDQRCGLLSGTRYGSPDVADSARFAMQLGIQCIGTCSRGEFDAARDAMPWVHNWFFPLYLRALDESITVRILEARKQELEEFHRLRFSDAALSFAAHWAQSSAGEGYLPGKALELLDAAGARIKLRQAAIPEVAEIEKRLAVIANREADAIAGHEFEKARLCSDEAARERNALQILRESLGLEKSAEPSDLEQVIARWATYPYSSSTAG
jgi:ATP-dependent Clp protease ATP-binding subunit ClpC